MIVIDVQTKAVEARLHGMINQISHFKRVDIGAELSSWQTENMHRRRPFTMRSVGKGTAATIVRPHSLYEMMRSSVAERRFVRARTKYEKFLASGRKRRKRRPKYVVIAERGWRRFSNRPILRSELIAKLKERTDNLLGEKLSWKRSSGAAAAAHTEDAAEHIIKTLIIRQFGAAGAVAVRAYDAANRGG
jgi:hypothetical protein